MTPEQAGLFRNMMSTSDNLPVGILLCTQKDHAIVEYALAGMDNSLFVSKYQLELPKKDDIQRFLKEQMQAGLVPGWQVKERRAIYLVHRKGHRE